MSNGSVAAELARQIDNVLSSGDEAEKERMLIKVRDFLRWFVVAEDEPC